MTTANTSGAIPARDRLAEQRVLLLGEAVDDESANRIVAQLLVLSADDPVSDICLY
ncbi:MAG: ATP-dependent Clp protease proteolytic subunit, partial [Actinomycetota bacterium]